MGFDVGIEWHFAQGLIEDASGFLALELHFDPLHVAVGCVRMMDAAGQAKHGAADQGEMQNRTRHGPEVCYYMHTFMLSLRHGMSRLIWRLTGFWLS
jgi:hypothetical protein